MNRLLEIGFECCGHWILEGEHLRCEQLKHKSTPRVLYGFAVDGEVVYIGKTVQSLERRMAGYRRPGPTQSTNIRNHAKILDTLRAGSTVDIFVLPDPGLLRYGVFQVNLAAGLEDEIISVLQPEWNISGRSTRQVLVARIEEELEEIREEENPPKYIGAVPIAPARSTKLRLGKTYFHGGFFNTGVDTSKEFGEDGDAITIHIGDGGFVMGYINRTTNSNRSPRIFGGKELKDWFQASCHLDDELTVEILGPREIRLRRPVGK